MSIYMKNKTIAKSIAFQGSLGANSNLACQKFYPNFEAKAFFSFAEIFKAILANKVDYAMIPLENSYAGRVSEIHNLLQESNVTIIAEHFLPIEHHLVGINDANIKDIKEVYSHPQALMQCQKTLSEFGLKSHSSSNTAEAAKYVASKLDKSKAALCSSLASKLNGLKILKQNLQDSDENMTLFVVIAKNNPKNIVKVIPKNNVVITSLLFTVGNIPSSLFKALGSFATNNINMIKIESYIASGFSSEAKFFISVEAHPDNKNFQFALMELKFFCKKVKIIGVYYADQLRYKKPSNTKSKK
jgi:prephenate dehydratase